MPNTITYILDKRGPWEHGHSPLPPAGKESTLVNVAAV